MTLVELISGTESIITSIIGDQKKRPSGRYDTTSSQEKQGNLKRITSTKFKLGEIYDILITRFCLRTMSDSWQSPHGRTTSRGPC